MRSMYLLLYYSSLSPHPETECQLHEGQDCISFTFVCSTEYGTSICFLNERLYEWYEIKSQVNDQPGRGEIQAQTNAPSPTFVDPALLITQPGFLSSANSPSTVSQWTYNGAYSQSHRPTHSQIHRCTDSHTDRHSQHTLIRTRTGATLTYMQPVHICRYPSLQRSVFSHTQTGLFIPMDPVSPTHTHAGVHRDPHRHAFVHTQRQLSHRPPMDRHIPMIPSRTHTHRHNHIHPPSHVHRQMHLHVCTDTAAGTRAHTRRPTHKQACSRTCCRGTHGQLCGCSCDLLVPGASVWTVPHHFLLQGFQFQTRTPDSLQRPSHPLSSSPLSTISPSVQCFSLPLPQHLLLLPVPVSFPLQVCPVSSPRSGLSYPPVSCPDLSSFCPQISPFCPPVLPCCMPSLSRSCCSVLWLHPALPL